MTPKERKRLRELCEKATPGPWDNAFLGHPAEIGGRMKPDEALEYLKHHTRDRDDFSFVYCMKPDGQADVAFTGCGPTSPENAAFISAARAAVPALLDALEASEAKIESMGLTIQTFEPMREILRYTDPDVANQVDEIMTLHSESAALRERVAVLEKVMEAAEAWANKDFGAYDEQDGTYYCVVCSSRIPILGEATAHAPHCPVTALRVALAGAKGKGE